MKIENVYISTGDRKRRKGGPPPPQNTVIVVPYPMQWIIYKDHTEGGGGLDRQV